MESVDLYKFRSLKERVVQTAARMSFKAIFESTTKAGNKTLMNGKNPGEMTLPLFTGIARNNRQI
jgi:hypothetical protein